MFDSDIARVRVNIWRKKHKRRERRQHHKQPNDYEEADTSESDDDSGMDDTSEADNTSEDDTLSTSSDDLVTISASKLASTIQQFGRGLDLSTKLCQACRSVIGWFFHDRCNIECYPFTRRTISTADKYALSPGAGDHVPARAGVPGPLSMLIGWY